MHSLKIARCWAWWRAAAAMLICVLVTATLLPAQDVSAKVQQILNTPQRYSGSMIIDLAQLGSPAVPALTENLYTYRFPLVILRALTRINDPSAASPLLVFINRVSADPDRHEQVLMAIALLRDFNYTPAEPTLHFMTSDKTTSLATRLAAASALAKWGSPPVRQEATAIIMQAAREHPVGTRSMRDDVLDEALGSIGSDESRSVLIERLGKATLSSEQGRIIHLLAHDPAPASASTLLEYAERIDRNPRLRFYAAKTLLNSGMNFPADRLLAALQQIKDVLPPDSRAEAEEIARRLAP